MARRKQAEGEFAKLMNELGVWCHKWRDVQRCPRCKLPLFEKKKIDGVAEDEPQQTIVDYLIFTFGESGRHLTMPHWVEVKGKGDMHRFAFSDITDKQRAFMDDWTQKDVPAWLFLSMGEGRIPNRHVFMIPWEIYSVREEQWMDLGMKSIPYNPTNRKADHNLSVMGQLFDFRMTWQDGGWALPVSHLFYTFV